MRWVVATSTSAPPASATGAKRVRERRVAMIGGSFAACSSGGISTSWTECGLLRAGDVVEDLGYGLDDGAVGSARLQPVQQVVDQPGRRRVGVAVAARTTEVVEHELYPTA